MTLKSRHTLSGQRALSRAYPWIFSLMVLVMVAGCATTEHKDEATRQEPEIIWPKPPDEPRIRFIKSVDGPEDLGIKKGFFRKLVEFFTGPDIEGFARPYGVTVDKVGRIFVADTGDGSYHMLDPADGRYERVDRYKDDLLRSPVGIAVDNSGNVYVSDAILNAVFCFDKDGKGIRSFGQKDLSRPAGIFIDEKTGSLYVADTLGHRIVVYDLQGNKRFEFGERGEGDGQFNYPTNLWVDSQGTILVCDSMNFRVQLFDGTGKFIGKFGEEGNRIGTFAKPKGIAVDSEGHVYVVEALYDAVQIFDQKGQVYLSFGASGRDRGEFWLPAGIWIDALDRIYVVDSYNQRVQIFQYIKRG